MALFLRDVAVSFNKVVMIGPKVRDYPGPQAFTPARFARSLKNSITSGTPFAPLRPSSHFVPRTVRARGSELMSTPTIIQAHIADLLFDDHDPGIVVSETADHLSGSRRSPASDSSRFNRAVKLASDVEATDRKTMNVPGQSSEKQFAHAGAASLDDFGGRSDALGG